MLICSFYTLYLPSNSLQLSITNLFLLNIYKYQKEVHAHFIMAIGNQRDAGSLMTCVHARIQCSHPPHTAALAFPFYPYTPYLLSGTRLITELVFHVAVHGKVFPALTHSARKGNKKHTKNKPKVPILLAARFDFPPFDQSQPHFTQLVATTKRWTARSGRRCGIF
jgi:hypothetical protein